MVQFFAHNGVEHTTEHINSSKVPIILAVTAVAILVVSLAARFLSDLDTPKKKGKS
jgi:hypothetical protein